LALASVIRRLLSFRWIEHRHRFRSVHPLVISESVQMPPAILRREQTCSPIRNSTTWQRWEALVRQPPLLPSIVATQEELSCRARVRLATRRFRLSPLRRDYKQPRVPTSSRRGWQAWSQLVRSATVLLTGLEPRFAVHAT